MHLQSMIGMAGFQTLVYDLKLTSNNLDIYVCLSCQTELILDI